MGLKHDKCASAFDYESVLQGDVFTFVIGPEKKRFTVHTSALAAISEPLGHMMTNTQWTESINKEAELPDCDPETFAQLAKYAYMGRCGVSDDLVAALDYRCHRCGKHPTSPVGYPYPFCTVDCRNRFSNDDLRSYQAYQYTVFCIVKACGNSWRLDTSRRLLCASHAQSTDTAVTSFPLRELPLGNAANQGARANTTPFASRTYDVAGLSHQAFGEHLDKHRDKDTQPSPDPQTLLRPAKLYLLAHKYLVEDLQAVCLHKLHRNLIYFNIHDTTIDEIIDLVPLIYSGTPVAGDISRGTNDPLRKLVMAYVQDQTKALVKYEGFRAMLGAGGSHTSDFLAIAFGQF